MGNVIMNLAKYMSNDRVIRTKAKLLPYKHSIQCIAVFNLLYILYIYIYIKKKCNKIPTGFNCKLSFFLTNDLQHSDHIYTVH